MDDNQKFTDASKEERRRLELLFKQRGVNLYEFTDDEGFKRYDAQITANTGNVIMIEAKCRTNDSSAYTYSTIIEHSKVHWLLDKTRGTNIKPVCTFFFTDNKAFIVELDHELYYNGTWVLCNETTCGEQTKVWKYMCIFQIDPKKLIKLK